VERAETIPEGSRGQVASKSAGSVCAECGRTVRELQALGLCAACYHRQWRKTEDRSQWKSRKYPDGCIQCGTKDSKHQGHGLCVGCYSFRYSLEHRERLRELSREGYHRHKVERRAKENRKYAGSPEYRRKRKEREWRNRLQGNRLRALQRADFRCERCGYDRVREVLEVHHKDRKRSNNDLSNLEALCPTCHKEQHYGS
jgi:hypothetical protein